jgi:hypothetical protein
VGPLIQPTENGVVPLDAVLRLQNPVVLVREVQHLGGNTLPLKSSEGGDAFGYGDTEIHASVNNKRWSLPVGDISGWRELLVQVRIRGWGSLVFPLHKPDFLAVIQNKMS